jgi:hypothetical protein
MKKLIFITLLAVMYSCGKHDYNCYLCNVDSVVRDSRTSYVVQLCDKTEQEIKEKEWKLFIPDSSKMWRSVIVMYNCEKMQR